VPSYVSLKGLREALPKLRSLGCVGLMAASELRHLHGVPLQHLHLSCLEIETLQYVKTLPLVSLHLSRCWRLGGLDALVGHPRLTELKIRMCGSLKIDRFAALVGLPLKTLSYQGHAISSAQTKAIATFGATLRHLDIRNSPLSMDLLLALRTLRLETLTVACDFESRFKVEALVKMQFCGFHSYHIHNFRYIDNLCTSSVTFRAPCPPNPGHATTTTTTTTSIATDLGSPGPECAEDSLRYSDARPGTMFVEEQMRVAAAWTTTKFWTPESKKYDGSRLRKAIYKYVMRELQENREVHFHAEAFPLETLGQLCFSVGGVRHGLVRLNCYTHTSINGVGTKFGEDRDPLLLCWPSEEERSALTQ
jgi:hypothetical protein